MHAMQTLPLPSARLRIAVLAPPAGPTSLARLPAQHTFCQPTQQLIMLSSSTSLPSRRRSRLSPLRVLGPASIARRVRASPPSSLKAHQGSAASSRHVGDCVSSRAGAAAAAAPRSMPRCVPRDRPRADGDHALDSNPSMRAASQHRAALLSRPRAYFARQHARSSAPLERRHALAVSSGSPPRSPPHRPRPLRCSSLPSTPSSSATTPSSSRPKRRRIGTRPARPRHADSTRLTARPSLAARLAPACASGSALEDRLRLVRRCARATARHGADPRGASPSIVPPLLSTS